MPIGDGTDLMDLFFHLPNPDEEARVCEEHQSIWAELSESLSEKILVSEPVRRLDDEVRIDHNSLIVVVLHCTTEALERIFSGVDETTDKRSEEHTSEL